MSNERNARRLLSGSVGPQLPKWLFIFREEAEGFSGIQSVPIESYFCCLESGAY